MSVCFLLLPVVPKLNCTRPPRDKPCNNRGPKYYDDLQDRLDLVWLSQNTVSVLQLAAWRLIHGVLCQRCLRPVDPLQILQDLLETQNHLVVFAYILLDRITSRTIDEGHGSAKGQSTGHATDAERTPSPPIQNGNQKYWILWSDPDILSQVFPLGERSG